LNADAYGDDLPMSDDDAMMPESAGSADRSEPGVAARRAGRPRPALIGAGLVAAVVLLLLAVFLLRPGDDTVGEASPSPSAAPTTAEPTATASPTAQPTAAPTTSAPTTVPEAWIEGATFSEPGKRYVLGDLVAWSDGLVAVGTLYEQEARSVFGPPPPRSGRVWRSTDGTSWADVTPTGTFEDVELTHLFEAADGALIVIGNAYPELDPVSVAWESREGETWSPAQLVGIPGGAFVVHVASGAQGHVASAYVGADSHPLYSSDGRTWEPTLANSAIHTVAAGDEGFVANVTSDGTEAMTGIVASADGLEWFDATQPSDGTFLAAPRGGDWLATTTTFSDSVVDVATWDSANGLDWSHVADITLGSVEYPTVTCSESPAVMHGLSWITVMGTVLFGPCSEGAVIGAGTSYASLDGSAWVPLPFGEQAFAAGAAMAGDRIVIATDARTNQAAVIGVTFWISDE
jgi:hypothetical protein